MNNLAEIRERKAALKVQIEQQRSELKKTFIEIREEVEPANLLKNAVSGLFKPSKNKKGDTQTGVFDRLPPSLSFLADLLIKDPRTALLVKLLAPLAMKLIPNQAKAKAQGEIAETTTEIPVKARIYSGLRQTISSFRKRLKKAKPTVENGVETIAETKEN